jgi:hypothetical protein
MTRNAELPEPMPTDANAPEAADLSKVPPEILELVQKGMLRYISTSDGVHEWVIDALTYTRKRGGMDDTMITSLFFDEITTGEGDQPYKFEITENSLYNGDDNLEATNDVDEVVAWIEDRK